MRAGQSIFCVAQPATISAASTAKNKFFNVAMLMLLNYTVAIETQTVRWKRILLSARRRIGITDET
jgi:hypothetical protein